MNDLRLYMFECGTLRCKVHNIKMKLHEVARRTGAQVVTGHDPDAWPKFKHAPEFYD